LNKYSTIFTYNLSTISTFKSQGSRSREAPAVMDSNWFGTIRQFQHNQATIFTDMRTTYVYTKHVYVKDAPDV